MQFNRRQLLALSAAGVGGWIGLLPHRVAADPDAGEEIPYPDLAANLQSQDFFERTVLGFFRLQQIPRPRDWDRVSLGLYDFLTRTREYLSDLPPAAQYEFLNGLYGYVRHKRSVVGKLALAEPGRPLIVFAHPDLIEEGALSDRAQVAKRFEFLAKRFRTTVEIFAAQPYKWTAREAMEAFAQRVGELGRKGQPATVWFWTHAHKDSFEIKGGESVSADQLAFQIMSAATQNGAVRQVSFRDVYWVVDTCYATDFAWALETGLLNVASFNNIAYKPSFLRVTSTARDRVSWDVSFANAVAKQYLHYNPAFKRLQWEKLELQYILNEVDFYLFGQGREAVLDENFQIAGWKVVRPDRLQDLVVSLWLTHQDVAAIRKRLRVPPGYELSPHLQIG